MAAYWGFSVLTWSHGGKTWRLPFFLGGASTQPTSCNTRTPTHRGSTEADSEASSARLILGKNLNFHNFYSTRKPFCWHCRSTLVPSVPTFAHSEVLFQLQTTQGSYCFCVTHTQNLAHTHTFMASSDSCQSAVWIRRNRSAAELERGSHFEFHFDRKQKKKKLQWSFDWPTSEELTWDKTIYES